MGCKGSKSRDNDWETTATPAKPQGGAGASAPSTLLTSKDKPPGADAEFLKPVAEATAKLTGLFDGLEQDAEKTVAAAALAAALRSSQDELAKMLEAANMNPISYILEQLLALGDGRMGLEKFLGLATLPMTLVEGQLAKVASSGEIAKVLKRTTTDVQLEMPDRSVQWHGIDDVRMAEQPTALAQLKVGDKAEATDGVRGDVVDVATTDVKLALEDGSSKWYCLEDLTKVEDTEPARSQKAAQARVDVREADGAEVSPEDQTDQIVLDGAKTSSCVSWFC